MIDFGIWIALIGLIVTVVSLIITTLSYRQSLKQSYLSQSLLKDINKNQEKQIKILRRQVKRLEKGQPKNEQLEKEKLDLKRKEQENKEKWKQVDTIFKAIKLFSDLED